MEEVCTSTRVKESLPIDSDDSASSTSSSSTSRLISWRPRPLAFHPYSPIPETNLKSQPLRVVVRRPLVARLTKDIVEIYQQCDPQFRYSEEYNPKGFLTSPSIGLLNDGFDNAKSDLILSVNYSLVNSEKKRRYIVKGILGQGTFGQVAKCWLAETKTFVAVKIIKNSPAYYQQAVVEVSILSKLNETFDPEDKHHIVRMYDYFKYQNHLCIVFELLDTNLYELIKLTHFRGLSLSIVQLFSKQILRGLTLMKDAAIIHCDLKPENIMLFTSVKPAEIKIIDFGSACMEHHTVYSYIQSRYYRSPEVVLGYQYTTAIDMWSFGCIVAELFLGLPLFPGASEFDLLRRMIKILGNQPPDYILRKAKNTSKFFKFVGSFSHEERDLNHRSNSMFRALAEEEYASRESSKPAIGKEYFNNMNLKAIVTKFPYRKNLADEEIAKETQMRLALIDFLRGLVEFDPAKRWSPLQASKHPFVTGEPFTHPYKPAQETPHMPVSQNVKVDHHPAGGHWFAAGLSPNVSGRTRTLMPSSPHYQLMSHANSYGSLGSHGSYNDSLALGSSYGSYGDGSNFHAFYSPAGPSGMNFYAQSGVSVLGSSPDTRRIMQISHSNGIGFSPGNLVPMSLGSSPSQFTPPGSFGQISAGSPGHYGPPSPVRGNCHGSPLGKMASGSHYNRRKNWAYHANFQSQDSVSSSSCQGQVADSKTCSQSEGNSSVLVGSPLHGHPNASSSTWRPQQGGRSITSGFSTLHTQNIQGSGSDKSEASNVLPDPGDWDPNYSEELLLQEDSSEVSSMASEFNKRVHLRQSLTPNEALDTTGRPSLISNAFVSTQRYHGSAQNLSFGEAGANPETHGYSHMTSKSYFAPHVASTSPSRLGQQPNQRHNFGRSAPFREGRRGNYLVSNAPPAFHGRKDYGRST